MSPQTSLVVQIVVFTLGLPVGVFAGVAIGGLAVRRHGLDRRPALLGLAVAAGLLTALLGTGGLPPFPPVDTLHWIPFATLAAALLLVVFDLRPLRGADALSGAVALAVAAMGGWLVLAPLIAAGEASVMWSEAGTLLVLVPVLAFDRASGRSPGPADLAALTCTAVGASIAMVLAHSALLGQMLGSVAAVLGAATLLAWRRPALAPGHAATGAAYLTIALLVQYGLGYADLPLPSALLVLVAPRLAATAARALGGFRALALAGAVAALPAAAAAYLAFAKAEFLDGPADESATGADYESLY